VRFGAGSGRILHGLEEARELARFLILLERSLRRRVRWIHPLEHPGEFAGTILSGIRRGAGVPELRTGRLRRISLLDRTLAGSGFRSAGRLLGGVRIMEPEPPLQRPFVHEELGDQHHFALHLVPSEHAGGLLLSQGPHPLQDRVSPGGPGPDEVHHDDRASGGHGVMGAHVALGDLLDELVPGFQFLSGHDRKGCGMG
jgi:hypothetical protein